MQAEPYKGVLEMVYNQADELRYAYHQKKVIDEGDTGGVGTYYALPEEVTKEDLPQAIASISQTVYFELDKTIDRTIEIGNKILTPDQMPIKDFIAGMYHITSMSESNQYNLAKTTIIHPVYGVGQIASLARRSFECFDIAGHEDLLTLEPSDPQLQPFMHRAYRLNYGSIIPSLNSVLDDIFLGDMSNQSEDDVLMNEKRIRQALLWLVKQNMPVSTVDSMISSSISDIQGKLSSYVYQAMALASQYLLLVPNQIHNAMYKMKNQALIPFYKWASLLPPCPADVDTVLSSIVRKAEESMNKTIQSATEILKLSEYENMIHTNQIKLMTECNKYMNIQNLLKNIIERETNDLDDSNMNDHVGISKDINIG